MEILGGPLDPNRLFGFFFFPFSFFFFFLILSLFFFFQDDHQTNHNKDQPTQSSSLSFPSPPFFSQLFINLIILLFKRLSLKALKERCSQDELRALLLQQDTDGLLLLSSTITRFLFS